MGLDMHAFAFPANTDRAVDVTLDDSAIEIFYWRKFNALHGWMEHLYRHKGGSKESFNCTTVGLDLKDLDRLEMDFSADKSVAEFIAKARQAIADGSVVYYYSWW